MLGLFAACADEDNVAPTADRSGITSLTAYFTSGPYLDKTAVDWKVGATEDVTDYVIPIPYWYPVETDNTTEAYMDSMKVVAQLENNCTLSPALGILDLTKKNPFTYTDPYGNKKQITISGEMTKPADCSLLAFMAQPGDLGGVIDEDAKTVSLITADDLSQMTAEVTLSPHAMISPDPAEAHNFNDGFKFTVTAANGMNSADYTVLRQVPAKTAMGYRKGSEKVLFENDMTTLGVTSANAIHPTLACVGNNVVLDLGDGSVPQYFKVATGVRQGTIALGKADASGAVTSDDAGNMLICNLADDGQTLKIYKTNDVTKEPEPFITYDNGLGVAIGGRLQVSGDLNGNAVVTATPYSCQKAIRWIVRDGKPGPAENLLFASLNAWGGQDGSAKVCAVDATGAEGAMLDYYQDGACQMYYLPDWATPKALASDGTGNSWGFNTGAMDVRTFNHARYAAVFEQGYWPDWGLTGNVYVFDASNPASINGTYEGSSALILKHTVGNSFASIGYADDGRTSDVLLAPSADGYFLYIFYASNTHLSFGCVRIDYIAK